MSNWFHHLLCRSGWSSSSCWAPPQPPAAPAPLMVQQPAVLRPESVTVQYWTVQSTYLFKVLYIVEYNSTTIIFIYC